MAGNERVTKGNKGKLKKTANQLLKPLPIEILIGILLVATVGKLLLGLLPSYKIDMGGYRGWADFLVVNPFNIFYRDVHCVYGPVYMYMLWVTGIIVKTFSLAGTSPDFFVKIWSILFDILGGVFIYLIGKKYNKERFGLLLGLLYAFNPAVFFNSSVWGQFDTITATMLLAVVYFFNLKKINVAVFIYGVAALTKPQSIALFPLVVILYFKDFPWKKFVEYRKTKDLKILKSTLLEILKKLAIPTAGCLMIYFIIFIPFFRPAQFYVMKEFEVYSDSNQSNMTVNKSISSSSNETSTLLPGNVADGNLDTNWSSEFYDGQWISVDLGTSTKINRVILKWGYDYAKKYDIQVSQDGQKWTSVYSETKGNGKDDDISFSPVATRFIKVDCLRRGFPYGLFEIKKDTNFIKKAAYNVLDFYYALPHHYTRYVDDYPYATANGFNLWTVLGKQCVDDRTPSLFGLTLGNWAYLLLFGGIWVLASVLLLKKRKSVLALYYAGYFLTVGMFIIGPRMHERYMVPAVIFAIVCLLWDKKMWVSVILASAACLANQWYTYIAGNADRPWIPSDDKFAMAVAWVSLVLMVLSIVHIVYLTLKKNKTKAKLEGDNAKGKILQN